MVYYQPSAAPWTGRLTLTETGIRNTTTWQVDSRSDMTVLDKDSVAYAASPVRDMMKRFLEGGGDWHPNTEFRARTMCRGV